MVFGCSYRMCIPFLCVLHCIIFAYKHFFMYVCMYVNMYAYIYMYLFTNVGEVIVLQTAAKFERRLTQS